LYAFDQLQQKVMRQAEASSGWQQRMGYWVLRMTAKCIRDFLPPPVELDLPQRGIGAFFRTFFYFAVKSKKASKCKATFRGQE
jgi:hypothetical protein